MITPWFLFLKMRRRKLYHSCVKNSYWKVKYFFRKQKFLFNIFMKLSLVGQNTFVWPVHFRYRRHHQNKSIEILLTMFVELSTVHLLKKIKVLTFVCGEIFSNYWMSQNLWNTRYCTRDCSHISNICCTWSMSCPVWHIQVLFLRLHSDHGHWSTI